VSCCRWHRSQIRMLLERRPSAARIIAAPIMAEDKIGVSFWFPLYDELLSSVLNKASKLIYLKTSNGLKLEVSQFFFTEINSSISSIFNVFKDALV